MVAKSVLAEAVTVTRSLIRVGGRFGLARFDLVSDRVLTALRSVGNVLWARLAQAGVSFGSELLA